MSLEESVDSLPESPASPTCHNCGASLFTVEGKVPLCTSCRTQFINYPIPKWIKAFGVGILALMVISLVSLPRQVRTGVHLKKGMVASKDRRYLTAQKELQQVVDHEPHYAEAQCRLLIAAFYNGDLATVVSCYKKLENEKVEDNALFQDVTSVLNRMGTFMPTDSFAVLQNAKPGGLTEADYVNYFAHHAHDVYAMESFAQLLIDHQKYAASDSVLNEVLRDNPNHYAGLAIKIPLKREENQIDSAYYYINQMLALNKEDAFALASRSRILLKQHKDKEALEVARQTLALNPASAYSLASMALVYHYQNDIPKRDALMAQAEKDSTLMPSFNYVKDVISGKEKFRD